MSREEMESVTAIVAGARRRRLVGRIRLQKISYLLKQLGAPIPFRFGYYHYGPYASELEKAVYDAVKSGMLQEEIRARQSDGAPYSIFVAGDDIAGKLPQHFAEKVARLAEVDPIVLELAATAHWLSEVEKVKDWQKEIRLRKTWKVEEGRLDKALALLEELGLPPAARNSEAPSVTSA
jgi:uncharacterized protein YwgA